MAQRVQRTVNQFAEPVDRSLNTAIDHTRAAVGLGPQAPQRAPAQGVPVTAAAKATAAPAQPKKKSYNPLVGLAKESWSMVKDSAVDLMKLPKAMLGYDTTGTGARGRPIQPAQPAPVAAAAPVAHPAAHPVAAPVAHPGAPAGAAPLPGGPLPEGWGFAYDQQGRIYFLNHKARTTTYEDPRGVPPPYSGADPPAKC